MKRILLIYILCAPIAHYAQIDTLLYKPEKWIDVDSLLTKDTIQEERNWCCNPMLPTGHEHTYVFWISKYVEGKTTPIVSGTSASIYTYDYEFDKSLNSNFLFEISKRVIDEKRPLILIKETIEYLPFTNDSIMSLDDSIVVNRPNMWKSFYFDSQEGFLYYRELSIVKVFGVKNLSEIRKSLEQLISFQYLKRDNYSSLTKLAAINYNETLYSLYSW